jgi:hypothetical protein
MESLQKAKSRFARRRQKEPAFDHFISEMERRFAAEWRLIDGKWEYLFLGIKLRGSAASKKDKPNAG